MQGRQFWIMMAVLAFLAWLGVRYFAQSVSESVTGEIHGTVIVKALT